MFGFLFISHEHSYEADTTITVWPVLSLQKLITLLTYHASAFTCRVYIMDTLRQTFSQALLCQEQCTCAFNYPLCKFEIPKSPSYPNVGLYLPKLLYACNFNMLLKSIQSWGGVQLIL